MTLSTTNNNVNPPRKSRLTNRQCVKINRKFCSRLLHAPELQQQHRVTTPPHMEISCAMRSASKQTQNPAGFSALNHTLAQLQFFPTLFLLSDLLRADEFSSTTAATFPWRRSLAQRAAAPHSRIAAMGNLQRTGAGEH